MNTRDGNKLQPSVSVEKQKSVTECLMHKTASVLLTKSHQKLKQSRTQRKENFLRAAGKTASSRNVDEIFDGKRLYIVRHGERVDFTFGSNWIQHSFDARGNYARFDMNMPKTLPERQDGPQSFADDSPLSVQGLFQARILGEAMSESKITFSHVYSSPALRCIQTADGILSGLGVNKAIYIEPGIFEWMAWHQNGLPTFMTASELVLAGYNISASHQPIWSMFDLKETVSDYYDRCHKTTSSIVERHNSEGGNILMVSHKGSVDVCIRQLVGNNKLPLASFRERVSKVPYCAVSCCMQTPDGKWKLVPPGLPCFTHSANKNYDWRIWL